MKTPFIISLLFIKSLMGINSGNIEDTSSGNITCYDCSRLYVLNEDVNVNSRELTAGEEFNSCNKTSSIIQGKKGDLFCKINMELMSGMEVAIATYSISTKEDCIRENQKQIQDTICAESSCKKLSLCCEGDLCNSQGKRIKTIIIISFFRVKRDGFIFYKTSLF